MGKCQFKSLSCVSPRVCVCVCVHVCVCGWLVEALGMELLMGKYYFLGILLIFPTHYQILIKVTMAPL